jgi:hypothetical protein
MLYAVAYTAYVCICTAYIHTYVYNIRMLFSICIHAVCCTAYIHTYVYNIRMLFSIQHVYSMYGRIQHTHVYNIWYTYMYACIHTQQRSKRLTRTLLPNLLHIYTEKETSHSREANESVELYYLIYYLIYYAYTQRSKGVTAEKQTRHENFTHLRVYV